MNKVILVGNLTRDPELIQKPGGVSLCKFSIAVSRSYTNVNGERGTDFFNIIAWREQAESCAKYLSKGKKVAVSGSLQTGSYTDRENVKRYTTDVNATEVEFLSPVGNGGERGEQTAQTKANADNESLPF